MSIPTIFNKDTKTELFNDPQAFRAILAFLNAIKIGIKPLYKEEEEENRRNLDFWNLDSISEGSSSGIEYESEGETEIEGVG